MNGMRSLLQTIRLFSTIFCARWKSTTVSNRGAGSRTTSSHTMAGLVGACPAYIKHNSYGEFVFDWAWADAYHRNGIEYYPKLVIAAPFTPASGPRLMARTGSDSAVIKQQLIQAAVATVDEHNMSGAHWLFCDEDDREQLQQAGMLMRSDYQYHWSNSNYENFDHFLSQLSSKKRKNIRRERRKVAEANITTEVINGDDLDEEQWHILYDFYRITFLKKVRHTDPFTRVLSGHVTPAACNICPPRIKDCRWCHLL